MEDFYPLGPAAVPAELTRPSSTYKRKAWLAVASLAVFVALYLALAAWFVSTAVRLANEALLGGPDTFQHVLVGACAAFLALFMLKALFFIKRGRDTDTLEITAADQPRLFAFLHRLADEAGAPRPNRVFVSARVNAAVFYDLSILNLVFPSKKNLEIGLALVNVLTLSELKAVLAHEFGHFAQRSMAIGSWVYIAQQIASHIIAKRDALDKFLDGLSGVDIRIAWVGWLLSLIVWSIRSLLDSLLRLVVLAQRALSRQMEFQADLVAVSLTGSDELVHALHKLQAADDTWSRTLGFANSQLRKERLPHDLFEVQSTIIAKMARILDDADYGRVPQQAQTAGAGKHRIFKSSFAQPPQMWSTHPANADREANAKHHYLAAPHDARSAWTLFDNVDGLKQTIVTRLIGETKAVPISAEETRQALDDFYTVQQLEPRYRGAYLGRTITRHAPHAAELYEALADDAVIRALEHLYPAQLATDLTRLRDLREEKAALEALRDKVFEATGGRIVHRGREIRRRDLPNAIQAVQAEEAAINERIIGHDKACRSAHLAAARRLGGGWEAYLSSLIAALHYAEHAECNLRDAHGYFVNVFNIVTIGKVDSAKLNRLVAACNILHDALRDTYRQAAAVELDEVLRTKLGVNSWREGLGEFTLPAPSEQNINEWLRVLDSWYNPAANALNALSDAALGHLLVCEDSIVAHLREGTPPEPAPAPVALPDNYPAFCLGRERERQKRLGLWDRFRTADGLVPGAARLLVAGAIVGGVLGLGAATGLQSTVYVYNGLGRPVQVVAGPEKLHVRPYEAIRVEAQLDEKSVIETRTDDGRVIERFSPELVGHGQRYVYNVAGASPLVIWTAVYGNGQDSPPDFLGSPRWLHAHADIMFQEPPASVQTKGGGATRSVMSGAGDLEPDKALKVVNDPAQRQALIKAHADWDGDKAPHAAAWRAMTAR